MAYFKRIVTGLAVASIAIGAALAIIGAISGSSNKEVFETGLGMIGLGSEILFLTYLISFIMKFIVGRRNR